MDDVLIIIPDTIFIGINPLITKPNCSRTKSEAFSNKIVERGIIFNSDFFTHDRHGFNVFAKRDSRATASECEIVPRCQNREVSHIDDERGEASIRNVCCFDINKVLPIEIKRCCFVSAFCVEGDRTNNKVSPCIRITVCNVARRRTELGITKGLDSRHDIRPVASVCKRRHDVALNQLEIIKQFLL